MPVQVTDDKRREVVFLLRQELGRNEIARRAEVSTFLVTKISHEIGMEFSREDSRLATQARLIDLQSKRVELAAMFLVRAEEALLQMSEPTSYSMPDRAGNLVEHWVERPTFSDQRALAATASVAVQRSLEISRSEPNEGIERADSILDEIMTGIRAVADVIRSSRRGC